MSSVEVPDWDEMLPLADAAMLCGLSAQTLKLQAARGRLRARKLAGRWLTTRRWLESYLEYHARKSRAESRRWPSEENA